METTMSAHAGGADDLVKLDPDHPGFRDPDYRERRNTIARLALEYQEKDPVPTIAYTAEEQDVWRTVWRNLTPLHDELACREYLSCSEIVRLNRERIPQLGEVNATLTRETGFRMLPVAGLVSSRTFMSYLGRDIFLATQYIRHFSRPLYTPEPDVVHELVGHAATFAHPDFAAINRLFGDATNRSDDETVERIARVYWYTLEFGAVEEDGELKAYGAGLLSSSGELDRFGRGKAETEPLSIERMAETPFDPTDYQKVYYVASSFDAMVKEVGDWLKSL